MGFGGMHVYIPYLCPNSSHFHTQQEFIPPAKGFSAYSSWLPSKHFKQFQDCVVWVVWVWVVWAPTGDIFGRWGGGYFESLGEVKF